MSAPKPPALPELPVAALYPRGYTPSQMQEYAAAAVTAALAQAQPVQADDAARYQWLRDTSDPAWRPYELRYGESAPVADKRIDAAMAAAAASEGGDRD